MAIVEFVNKPNRSYKGMKNTINYVLRDDKTLSKFISGVGLNPNKAYSEMLTLKNIMGKTDKRLWYHFIQSFPPYDNVTPQIALEVAHKLAEYFKDEYQILIAVHEDKEHIHTHFILNTVNIVTGKKYTQNNKQRIEIQELSDKICIEYGLHTLSEYQKNTRKYIKPGEYRALQNGDSWKAELRRTIDTTLRYSKSREHFIKLMSTQGYGVKWEDTRKNITFTTPNGMKCRDRKLGDDEIYNKDYFEMVFNMNSQYDNDTSVPPVFKLMEEISGVLRGSHENEPIPYDFTNIDYEGLSKIEIETLINWLYYKARSKNALEEWQANSQKINIDFQSLLDLMEMGITFLNQNNEQSYLEDYENER